MKYECDNCGACCAGHLIVEADDLDVMREPRLVDANLRTAGTNVEKVITDLQDGMGRVLILACGHACSFLNKENKCAIYPTRPNVCVAMEAGDEQCQSARESAGLAPLPPLV